MLFKNAINNDSFKKHNFIEKSPFAENGCSQWNNQRVAVAQHSNNNQHKNNSNVIEDYAMQKH